MDAGGIYCHRSRWTEAEKYDPWLNCNGIVIISKEEQYVLSYSLTQYQDNQGQNYL